MKIITLQQIGYNAPSQANWCYQIYSVSFIDTKNKSDDDYNYSPSITMKANFAGTGQIIKYIKSNINATLQQDIMLTEIKGVYTKTGTPKITGIVNMPHYEDQEFIDKVVEFLIN